MKRLSTALILPAVCMSLCAGVQTRIYGTVKTKDGKPIANAKITLSRTDINLVKEITSNKDGSYMQVGLDPRFYTILVQAEGFMDNKNDGGMKDGKPKGIKFPIGEFPYSVTMYTQAEAREEALKNGTLVSVADPNAKAENDATEGYNAAVASYMAKDYPGALAPAETAVQKFKTLPKADDATAQAEQAQKLQNAERLYGIVAYEVGKADETRKELLAAAEPLLAQSFERNGKDQRVVAALLDLATIRHDAEATKKYQAVMDQLVPPRPEVQYNEAVKAHNEGDEAKAKVHVLKAIQMDPNYADSYWLLGVVEFGMNNLSAAKANFMLYQQKAPTGKKAGEVKEFLAELNKMKIK